MASLWQLQPFLCYVLLLLTAVVESALVKKKLTLTWEFGAPNGQERAMIKTNGQFPAPGLVVDEDDDVEVTVCNLMPENTTIHWHGLLMRETPWSDGVPGLSQKPIEPGESFVYRFRAYPPGQYWYHSHSRATLLDGLYGSLFIRRKPGTEGPWPMISQDPEDIHAMEKAANDPHVMVVSDWSQFNSTQYNQIFRESHLQLL